MKGERKKINHTKETNNNNQVIQIESTKSKS